MKKITLLFVASLITSLFLLGCGGKESSAPETAEEAAATAENTVVANQDEAEKAATEAEAKAKEMAERAEAVAKKTMEDLQKK